MMSIQDLGSVGELVAALATILTLVYLAIQIRQNTKTQVVNATFQALEPTWDFVSVLAQSPQLTAVAVKGLGDFHRLDDKERLQFVMWCMNILYAYDNLVGLFEAGMVPEETLQNAFISSGWFWRSPGLRQYSKTREGPRSKKLETYLDRFVGPPDEKLELPE